MGTHGARNVEPKTISKFLKYGTHILDKILVDLGC